MRQNQRSKRKSDDHLKYSRASVVHFLRISIYHLPHTYTRVKSYDYLNLPRASVFNFKRLDILWAWIRDPSKMLWPFEFLESFRYSISSVIIYHGPHTYTRVRSFGRLNFLSAFMFNFDHLDMLCTSIGYPSSKLWPFKFLVSLRCSFFSISIYHGPHTYTRVKS